MTVKEVDKTTYDEGHAPSPTGLIYNGTFDHSTGRLAECTVKESEFVLKFTEPCMLSLCSYNQSSV